MTVADGERDFRFRRFSDDFAQILRERIGQGELRSGERLNEVQLAREFGISRSPIREALQALAGEGLVEFVAGKGAYIGGISVQEVRDLGAVREALETHAVRIISDEIGADGIAALQASLDIAGGYRSHVQDLDFHETILRLTGNARLEQSATAVAAQLRLARSRSAQCPGRIAEARQEHRAIIAAIQEGDRGTAVGQMRAHIQRATHNACLALADQPSE